MGVSSTLSQCSSFAVHIVSVRLEIEDGLLYLQIVGSGYLLDFTEVVVGFSVYFSVFRYVSGVILDFVQYVVFYFGAGGSCHLSIFVHFITYIMDCLLFVCCMSIG